MDGKALPIDAEQLFAEARQLLPEAIASGRMAATRLPH